MGSDEVGAGVVEDLTVSLGCPEAMNKGKSFHWIRFALKQFDWATHIAKADMDAFVYPHRVFSSIAKRHQQSSSPCEHYYGEYHPTCERNAIPECPPASCGVPQNEDFFQYSGKSPGSCWIFMTGGFYVISQRLAERSTADGSWWSKHQKGIEDVLTGKAIFMTEPKPCIKAWSDRSWIHLAKDHCVDIERCPD